MRLIDANALYAKLQEHEELARKRVWDTASTLPFPNNLNPAYTRYLAQLDERTALKHMVADAPTIEQPENIYCRDCRNWEKIREILNARPEVIRCRDCKLRDTGYCNMAHGFMGMKDDDYCSYGERREGNE